MLNVKLLTLLFHLLSHITYASTLPPTVKTPNGTLTGLHNPHYAQDLFLGIPYAQPPTGPLRYRRPASLAQPYDSLDATRYGPGCHSAPVKVPVFTQNQPQHPESEDCLTLNIVRPAGLGSRDTKLPVLVFIYGGGFQEGSSGDQRYNMSFLVQESVDVGAPIIGVSINYRLSGFGFLPGSAVLESNVANLGLHDQRLALWWVKENIAAFGGDEDKVTIHGESAGAMSVGYHLLAYGGRDESLFRAAIVQSGGPANFARGVSVRAQDGFYDDLLGQTGCMLAEDSLDCLRSLPAEVLKAVFQDQTLLPVQDGDFFDGNSRVALKRGRFVRRPILAGANTNEGTSFTIGSGLSVSTPTEFRAVIAAWLGHGVASTTVDGIAAEYLERMSPEELQAALGTVLPSSRAEYGGLYGRATLFVGDHIFMAARRLSTEMWAEYGVPAYSYRFDTVPGGVSPETLGAAHFAEIPFVFGNVDGVGHEVNFLASDSMEEREEFVRLSKRMSRMWLSFVNELSPNAHYALDDDTIWPAYTKGSARNVVFRKIGISLEEDTWRANAITRMNSAAVGLEA